MVVLGIQEDLSFVEKMENMSYMVSLVGGLERAAPVATNTLYLHELVNSNPG